MLNLHRNHRPRRLQWFVVGAVILQGLQANATAAEQLGAITASLLIAWTGLALWNWWRS